MKFTLLVVIDSLDKKVKECTSGWGGAVYVRDEKNFNPNARVFPIVP